MINLDSCYKEKFMVTWPRAYEKDCIYVQAGPNLSCMRMLYGTVKILNIGTCMSEQTV